MTNNRIAVKEVAKELVSRGIEIAEGAQIELAESSGNVRAGDVALVSIACSLSAIAFLLNEVIHGSCSVSTYDIGRE